MANTEPVTAAGGVVFRNGGKQPEVVLIYRRGVWDLPKGKLEEGETVRECAVREVAEEIGVEDLPEVVDILMDTYHEYSRDGTHYGKTTYWFMMQLPRNTVSEFNPQQQEGIEKVRWVSLPEAKSKVAFDNLVDVLNSFEQLYNKNL